MRFFLQNLQILKKFKIILRMRDYTNTWIKQLWQGFLTQKDGKDACKTDVER